MHPDQLILLVTANYDKIKSNFLALHPNAFAARLVLGDQRLQIDALRLAVDHPLAAGDHHPFGSAATARAISRARC